ncbi:hypothetical protein CFBP5877_02595 [Agrobacterium tumefaciens]|uniref:Uncharacterized protein n=1 Tax=Agrobacterium tumefaciens TaxID=358 RepID=A0AAE6EE18_AGRTU|nr:hypothetical protein CFBP5499_03045 [Agrobacterium tumefaciens]QCL78081.1 hypothetical protein CFBP5877_02595 [Agrobacterium tumefaciens]
MLHFLHAFSREIAEDTPISSAIKGWTCVFVALWRNYSIEGSVCGKIFRIFDDQFHPERVMVLRQPVWTFKTRKEWA